MVNGEWWNFYGVRSHHSSISWYDGRWGDPYEDPQVLCRTSLMICILMTETKVEEKITESFIINPVYFKESYVYPKPVDVSYTILREACYAFRREWNEKEQGDSFTEKTAEHVIHLWNIYHGSKQYLIDQGKYHD